MQFSPRTTFSIAFFMDSVPFTAAVLAKQSSLGGSESACRVLAEALAARGHDVHIFATKLEEPGEYYGVQWHTAEELPEVLKFAAPDVFVSLRMPHVFNLDVPAKMRILWSQDLLIQDTFIGQLYALDRALFVSKFHLEQWCERQPPLRPIAQVIRNPIDPTDLVEAGLLEEGGRVDDLEPILAGKIPNSFIHISRPERGMDALLAIWPQLRARIPDATLSICRYSSMYDAGGWGQVCEAYDRKVAAVNARVGGIHYLGELNKVDLYREIAKHQVMLYPTSQPHFAETNCVAATEAQACGTVFVGSWRGALPETVAPDAGVLIAGDALTPEVQAQFVDVCTRLVADDTLYHRLAVAGRVAAMESYGGTVAAAFEREVRHFFEARYAGNRIGVLRQLLHWDNHAAALRVAREITTSDQLVRLPEYDEALDAAALCERVIRQEEQTAEHYAKFAMQSPEAEAAGNSRLHVAAEAVAAHRPKYILDVACGNGAMALVLAQRLPDAHIVGVDYSAGVLELARAAAERAGISDRVTFVQITGDQLVAPAPPSGAYDAVFCGEFIEHVEKPWELLDALEQFVHADGHVVLTTPCGPFAELLQPGIPRQRGHVHAFTLRDLAHMGQPKRDWRWQYLGIGISPRGTAVGYWLMQYQAGGDRAQPLDYTHAILTERPYQTVHAAMIVRDGQAWLPKCLDSFLRVVDHAFIYDTGSVDRSVAIAREFDRVTVVEGDWPEDFSVARNRSLALAEPGADWIFWIDADEQLEGATALRRYTVDGGIFNGYAIHQHHLMIDAPNFSDKPIRLFRAGKGYRFFGVVHEQPESAPDQGILPALDQVDMKIVHLGYHMNYVRRRKMLERNLPLLLKEINSGSPRQLAWVLYIRDAVNIATFDREEHRQLTVKGLAHLNLAIKTYFEQEFDNPAHPCHRIAWPYYQTALELRGNGIQVAWSFAAAQGRLKHDPHGSKYWARDVEEAERVATHRMKAWLDTLRGPHVRTAPVVPLSTDGWRLPAVAEECVGPVS